MFAVRMKSPGCPECPLFDEGCEGEIGVCMEKNGSGHFIHFRTGRKTEDCFVWDRLFDKIDNPTEEMRNYINMLALSGRG